MIFFLILLWSKDFQKSINSYLLCQIHNIYYLVLQVPCVTDAAPPPRQDLWISQRGKSYEPKSVNNNQTNKNKLIYALNGVLLECDHYTKLDFLHHVYMYFVSIMIRTLEKKK